MANEEDQAEIARATARITYRLPVVFCRKEINFHRRQLVSAVFGANVHRCEFMLMRMDFGWAVEPMLKKEVNNGVALSAEAKEAYRLAGWRKYLQWKRRGDPTLPNLNSVLLPRTATGLLEEDDANVEECMRCTFLSWAVTKIQPELAEGVEVPRGSRPVQGARNAFSRICINLNADLNRASKHGYLVRVYAAEASLYCPAVYHVEHPTLPLQGRSDANVRAADSFETRGLVEFTAKKGPKYEATRDDRLEEGFRFRKKADRPGVASDNDPTDLTVELPDWEVFPRFRGFHP